MWILSVRRRGLLKHKWVFCLIATAVITAACISLKTCRQEQVRVIDGRPLLLTAEGEGDIRRIADFFGADTEHASVEVSDMVIPCRFNRFYQQYNKMQQPTGEDLAAYSGRACRMYRLRFDNMSRDADRTMTLLTCDGCWIGGDWSDNDFHGRMYPLSAFMDPE